ncbi:putative helix-turn-helix, Fis-type [Brucella thiophenivorans]|uniref:Putative helix-turn-helix, Fis-type n=1 Tax=Brucella thiophenivorans TaxID=571255 RepID=A0A256FM68_9HYPH|nr:hypothetical protein [Brucella thiophenivorans]OYR15868.1 putative helix-turn-helix, Fis-type [Brucella thiophenivorans]
MNKTSGTSEDAADKLVKNIRRKTRQTYLVEESISVLYRREVIAESLYYSWSKEFLEAGKRQLWGQHGTASYVAGSKGPSL